MKAIMLLAVGLTLAACTGPTPKLAKPTPAPESTQAVGFTTPSEITPQAMPPATTDVVMANVMDVLPLGVRLNEAWKPILLGMKPGFAWSNASVATKRQSQNYDHICKAPGQLYDHKPGGMYCPLKADVAGASGYIMLSEGPLRSELFKLPEAERKPQSMLLISYFYALHLRHVMYRAGITPEWSEHSRTQWCLAGVSLRALWRVDAEIRLVDLPLKLTQMFTSLDMKEVGASWVHEGFYAPSVNSCFQPG